MENKNKQINKQINHNTNQKKWEKTTTPTKKKEKKQQQKTKTHQQPHTTKKKPQHHNCSNKQPYQIPHTLLVSLLRGIEWLVQVLSLHVPSTHLNYQIKCRNQACHIKCHLISETYKSSVRRILRNRTKRQMDLIPALWSNTKQLS